MASGSLLNATTTPQVAGEASHLWTLYVQQMEPFYFNLMSEFLDASCYRQV